MNLSVLIPAYRPDSIHETVRSIQEQEYTDWELIAVGQGSSDSERAQAVRQIIINSRKEDDRVRYVHIEQLGATRATNAGISEARGNIIAIIDDDCSARGDWLLNIVNFFAEHPEVGLIGGTVIKPEKTRKGFAVCPSLDVQETIYDPVSSNYQAPVNWDWNSFNVAMRREVAEKVGQFDEFMGPGAVFPAADDTDYKLRVEAHDVIMATSPNLVVYHTHGYRYGLRAVVDHHHSYNYGNGGLAGKLTLMGDPRGKDWWMNQKDQRIYRWLKPFRPDQIIRGYLGWRIFSSAYRHCTNNFQVKDETLIPL